MTRVAIDGVGLAFMTEEHASSYLASGVLVRVLEDRRDGSCPWIDGMGIPTEVLPTIRERRKTSGRCGHTGRDRARATQMSHEDVTTMAVQVRPPRRRYP